VVVCLGSLWYIEDRAGLEVCRKVKEEAPSNVSVIECEAGIERCIGLILREKPTIIVIVDSVLVRDRHEEYLGKIIVVDNLLEKDISGIFLEQLSTHKLPIKIVLEFLEKENPSLRNVIFVGIPVDKLTFCAPDEDYKLPEHVYRSVLLAVDYIISICSGCKEGSAGL